VGYRTGVTHLRHPQVGELLLHRNRFNIPHSGEQHLLTYRAEPGSTSHTGVPWALTSNSGPTRNRRS
jgi:hypothetical protein